MAPGWVREARVVRASRGRSPSWAPASATCAEPRGLPERRRPPRGGRGELLGSYHPAGPAGERQRGAPGPARQVAAPPRGRRAERNAPAAPARGRAAVGVASAPRLALTGCGAAGRARPGRPLAAGPSHLHTGRARGAGAGPRGREGAAAAAEVGLGVGDGPAPGSQVTHKGSQAGGRGRTPEAPPPPTDYGGSDVQVGGDGRVGVRDDPSACTAVPPGAGQPLPTAHCAAPDPLCV